MKLCIVQNTAVMLFRKAVITPKAEETKLSPKIQPKVLLGQASVRP